MTRVKNRKKKKLKKMNSNAKSLMIADLKSAANMNEVFAIFSEYYDLDNCRPGSITKAALIAQLDKAVIALNAKPKQKYK